MASNLAVQVLLAIYLGVGLERDALFVAMSVPLFLNVLMVGSFGAVVTPAVVAQGNHREQRRVATRMLRNLTWLAALLAASLYVFRGGMVQVLAPGFGAIEKAHTAKLLGIVLAMVPLQSATCVLGGYWIARERVLLPSVATLGGNFILIGILVLDAGTPSGGRVAMYYLIGAIVTCGVLSLAYLAERGSVPATQVPPVNFSPGDRHLYRDTVPLLASGFVGRSAPLIERHLASGWAAGTISCLGYAGYLLNFLVNATATPVATVYYAQMCRQWNEGRRDELLQFLEKGALLVAWGSLAVAGILLLTAHDLLGAVQPYTRFTAANMKEMADYASILMAAYFTMSLASLISRIFYISGEFLRAAWLDCVSVFCYLGLAIPLSRWLGGYGLVIATSIQMLLLVGLVAWSVWRKFDIVLPGRWWIGLCGILGGWVGCLGLCWFVRLQLHALLPPWVLAPLLAGFFLMGLAMATAPLLARMGMDWRRWMPQRRIVSALGQ